MRSLLLASLLAIGCATTGELPSPRRGLCATGSEMLVPVDCSNTPDPWQCSQDR